MKKKQGLSTGKLRGNLRGKEETPSGPKMKTGGGLEARGEGKNKTQGNNKFTFNQPVLAIVFPGVWGTAILSLKPQNPLGRRKKKGRLHENKHFL